MASNLNSDLNKIIGTLAAKYSRSEEGKAFISLLEKSSESQRKEIIGQLASLVYTGLMAHMEAENRKEKEK